MKQHALKNEYVQTKAAYNIIVETGVYNIIVETGELSFNNWTGLIDYTRQKCT